MTCSILQPMTCSQTPRSFRRTSGSLARCSARSAPACPVFSSTSLPPSSSRSLVFTPHHYTETCPKNLSPIRRPPGRRPPAEHLGEVAPCEVACTGRLGGVRAKSRADIGDDGETAENTGVLGVGWKRRLPKYVWSWRIS